MGDFTNNEQLNKVKPAKPPPPIFRKLEKLSTPTTSQVASLYTNIKEKLNFTLQQQNPKPTIQTKTSFQQNNLPQIPPPLPKKPIIHQKNTNQNTQHQQQFPKTSNQIQNNAIQTPTYPIKKPKEDYLQIKLINPFNFISIKPGFVHFKPNSESNSQPKFIIPPNQDFINKCLYCCDFTAVDAHAERFVRDNFRSVNCLIVNNLTSKYNSRTEKARAIFIWLHHNIAYDFESFLSGNVRATTPHNTMSSGLAVCQGYAELFQEIGKHSGLEVQVVSGHGKGYGYVHTGRVTPYKSNHAWNAVKLDDNNWHLIDPCWGAGHANGQNKYEKSLNLKYFNSSPEIFRLNHFPNDPTKQYCQGGSMSWEDYLTMRETPQIFGAFYKMDLNQESIVPRHKFIPPGRTTFLIESKCMHFRIQQKERYILLLSFGNGQFQHFNEDDPGKKWSCLVNLRGGDEVKLIFVETFNNWKRAQFAGLFEA